MKIWCHLYVEKIDKVISEDYNMCSTVMDLYLEFRSKLSAAIYKIFFPNISKKDLNLSTCSSAERHAANVGITNVTRSAK